MENTVQVPSDLPGLKAHGIHWATDVSILETQRKRKKRGTSLLQFNLRAARFFNQIIFLGNSSAAAHRLGLVFRVCLGANWYKVAISHWEMWTVTESLWFNPLLRCVYPGGPCSWDYAAFVLKNKTHAQWRGWVLMLKLKGWKIAVLHFCWIRKLTLYNYFQIYTFDISTKQCRKSLAGLVMRVRMLHFKYPRGQGF